MPKAKHIPLRRCVACRAQKPQGDLVRFYRDEAGRWHLDETRRAGGRGAWLCKDANCHKVKPLGRFFRQDAVNVAQQLNDLKLEPAGPAAGSAPEPSNPNPAGGTNVR